MKKVLKLISVVCVLALVLSCTAFAAAPSLYDGQSYSAAGYSSDDPDGVFNLAVIANSDVKIVGNAMYIQGSVYSNGNIYVGDGQGNKIDGLFISGTEGSLDPGNGSTDDWQCDGYIHVNSWNYTTDGITAYSTKPEYEGAIYDPNTSFECSYKAFEIPQIANDLGDVAMNVYYNESYVDWDPVNNVAIYEPDGTQPKTIAEDTHIGTLTMNGSQDNWRNIKYALTIDATNNDVNVVIDNLSAVNPSIQVVGDHRVNIYINNVSYVNNLSLNYYKGTMEGSTDNTYLYLTGDNVTFGASTVAANKITVNANSLEVSGSSKVVSDIDTNASNFTITGGQTEVTGTVCAPNAASKVVDSGTLYGQLHTDTLVNNGAGSIIWKADSAVAKIEAEPTATPGEEVEEPVDVPAGYIVHWNVVNNVWERGTMDTKMHSPARGEDEAEIPAYEVLKEGTFKKTGAQYISPEIEEHVTVIYEESDNAFKKQERKGQVSEETGLTYVFQPERFGRIDSNGKETSLSITPYAWSKIANKIGDYGMYLCWGDNVDSVTDVWYVVPEDMRAIPAGWTGEIVD